MNQKESGIVQIKRYSENSVSLANVPLEDLNQLWLKSQDEFAKRQEVGKKQASLY